MDAIRRSRHLVGRPRVGSTAGGIRIRNQTEITMKDATRGAESAPLVGAWTFYLRRRIWLRAAEDVPVPKHRGAILLMRLLPPSRVSHHAPNNPQNLWTAIPKPVTSDAPPAPRELEVLQHAEGRHHEYLGECVEREDDHPR